MGLAQSAYELMKDPEPTVSELTQRAMDDKLWDDMAFREELVAVVNAIHSRGTPGDFRSLLFLKLYDLNHKIVALRRDLDAQSIKVPPEPRA